ncbi:hypothetical protein C8R47DRAFT_1194051 [Mycena vitilis]|nr:hypothetical protein C8R47DRAFT_1194051 [Mycena vitilis]
MRSLATRISPTEAKVIEQKVFCLGLQHVKQRLTQSLARMEQHIIGARETLTAYELIGNCRKEAPMRTHNIAPIMSTDLSSVGDGDSRIIDYSKLFAKDTPPAPLGSSDWVVETTKAFYRGEHEAYIRLNGHPLILRYHGWDQRGLLFDSPRRGFTLLSPQTSGIAPIAVGLAFIHSKGIIWVDVSLPNILLSEDNRGILCDFAGSRILPVPGLKVPSWTDRETQVGLSPMKTMPRYPHARAWQGPGGPYPNPEPNPNEFNPNDDRFGFGIVLFSLLALRFPHSANLVIHDLMEVQKIWAESFVRHSSSWGNFGI